MSITITGTVTNGVIIPSSPLPEGATVEVIAVPATPSKPGRISMVDLLESLPTGPRAFPTWEEYEQHLAEEKASWER